MESGKKMILKFINSLGSGFLRICTELGEFSLFFFKSIFVLFSKKLKVKQVIIYLHQIGTKSFSIVFLTGLSSGFALAFQSYMGLSKFGGEELVGVVVAMGMTRELAPVLTGIMITGKAGSAMAAEIGTMKITEQIDALRTLCIDPYQYLIVPRIIAGTIALPLLSIISTFCGIMGGYIYSTTAVNINPEVYLATIQSNLEFIDLVGGIIKAAVFGLILSTIGTYVGLNSGEGAQGVGLATTKSVVVGSVLILIANYFLSLILF